MKIGRSLQALNEEVRRRVAAKQDWIVPVDRMELAMPTFTAQNEKVPPPVLRLYPNNRPPLSLEVAPIAHNQMIEFTKIPGQYYRVLQAEDPELLITNVNRRLHKVPEKRRMVRTLDGKCRALLSDGYRALENEDLADAVLPILMELDLLILSCEITDTRLYIKAVDKRILKDIPTGAKLGEGHVRFDTVSPAVTIANSEVGYGALQVESGVYTNWCTNMCSFGPMMRKYHTGARAELSDEIYALLTDETKKLTDAAVWAQARDLVRAAFDEAKFSENIHKLQDAADQKLEGDVVEVVKKVAKRYTLSEDERSSVLNHLIRSADLTRYGMHAAITRTAEDLPNYDRATEFERLGGKIIEMDRGEWKKLAEVA